MSILSEALHDPNKVKFIASIVVLTVGLTGAGDPSALVRLVLTAADTRDKVARPELAAAAQLAACLTAAACQVDGLTAANWRAGVLTR
jgi:hypothetical protein